jgi:hypothetical protein
VGVENAFSDFLAESFTPQAFDFFIGTLTLPQRLKSLPKAAFSL